MLAKYTSPGMSRIKESPARIHAARELGKKFGVQLKVWYLVMGRYDIVTVWEAPNDDAMSQLSLALGSLGNVTTETLRAHTEEEFKKLVVGLP
jgi:uncharacterized protein with GYD domain